MCGRYPGTAADAGRNRDFPAIPEEWDGFTMEKQFRGRKLCITVDNLAHREGRPRKVILNGQERAPGVIPEAELQAENRITVLM